MHTSEYSALDSASHRLWILEVNGRFRLLPTAQQNGPKTHERRPRLARSK